MTTLVLAGLAVVVDFIVRVVALLVIPRNRRPSTAMAWLMAIFFLPYIGIFLFLLIGSTRLPKRRREKQQEINRFIIESTEGIERVTREHSWPSWLDSVVGSTARSAPCRSWAATARSSTATTTSPSRR